MKKLSSKHSSAKTTASNLESRFASGRDVLDYFDVARAVVTHGGARPGAGRKPTGKLQKTVKLSPQAIRRFQAYARRKRLPDFSAALEAASRVVYNHSVKFFAKKNRIPAGASLRVIQHVVSR